jgi:phosphoserine phosphatase
MKKIIVYDFDKTLTYKDTLFGFFRYAAEKNGIYYIKVLLYLLSMISAKLNFVSNTKLKTIGVNLFLKNMNKKQVKKKSYEYSKKIKSNQLYHQLKFNNDADYYIVSASFKEYLKPMFPSNVSIVGSSLRYENDLVIGLEFNCYKEQKIFALNEFNLNSIDILYTDSYSDYPLARISKEINIVHRDNIYTCHKLEEFKEYFQVK